MSPCNKSDVIRPDVLVVSGIAVTISTSCVRRQVNCASGSGSRSSRNIFMGFSVSCASLFGKSASETHIISFDFRK